MADPTTHADSIRELIHVQWNPRLSGSKLAKVIENFETNLNHENFDIGKEYPLPSRNGMTFAFKAHWVNHPSETFEYPDEPPFLGIVDDRSDAEVHDDCSKARAERKMAYLEMQIEVGGRCRIQ